MAARIEFLFDFGSPTTYLAHKRLPDIAARTGAVVDYTPILLGGIFKATGNASPAMVPAKGRYMNADMARFAARHDIPLAINPHFPINTITLQRLATALLADPRFEHFTDAIFDAMWVEPHNLADPSELSAVLTNAGFDAPAVLAQSDEPAVKERLKMVTEEAVARGVFGCPTFFVAGEMFFGQDRLDWVEQAARG